MPKAMSRIARRSRRRLVVVSRDWNIEGTPSILERIAAQEAQMKSLLETLEKERSRADQAEATAEQRAAALQAAMEATRSLKSLTH